MLPSLVDGIGTLKSGKFLGSILNLSKSQLIFREFQFQVPMQKWACAQTWGYPKTILKMAFFCVWGKGWLTMRFSEILGDPMGFLGLFSPNP